MEVPLALVAMCYELHVSVPRPANAQVEILTPAVRVLEGGGLGDDEVM